jgi:hypothetical protein
MRWRRTATRDRRRNGLRFDYYPDSDTLIISLRHWPHDARTYSASGFTVVASELGDIVELEIRNASHFLARALDAGISLGDLDKEPATGPE